MCMWQTNDDVAVDDVANEIDLQISIESGGRKTRRRWKNQDF